MLLVADLLPGIHFLDQGLLVGDTSVETLRGQDAEFGFCHIEPTAVFGRVVPLEPLDEAACLCGGKSLVERSRFVSAEIILHEDDFRGAGKMDVRQFLENLRIIQRGVAIGRLDLSPALERRKHQPPRRLEWVVMATPCLDSLGYPPRRVSWFG